MGHLGGGANRDVIIQPRRRSRKRKAAAATRPRPERAATVVAATQIEKAGA